MIFDFDTPISRKNTDSFKWDKYAGTDILPFWVADMDFAVAPAIMDAIRQRIEHPVFGYTKAPDDLSVQVARHLEQEFSWKIEKEWLVWLPGVVPGLSASCRAVGKPGDEVIACPPVYHHILDVVQPAEKKLVAVPLKQNATAWEYNFPAIERALSARSKLMLVCSPHNPVGKVFTRSELERICELSASKNMVIVSDEIHCELVLDKNKQHIPLAVACPDYAQNVITLMSPSKTFNLAGMNCSFAIIQNKSLRRKFVDACEGVLPMVPVFSYTAALAAYQHGDEWRRQLNDYLFSNYQYLEKELRPIKGLQLTTLEATYLAWINTEKLGLSDPQKFFEDAGIGLSSGNEFGSDWSHYVRLNFACPRSMLEQGVLRIKQALNQRQGTSRASFN